MVQPALPRRAAYCRSISALQPSSCPAPSNSCPLTLSAHLVSRPLQARVQRPHDSRPLQQPLGQLGCCCVVPLVPHGCRHALGRVEHVRVAAGKVVGQEGGSSSSSGQLGIELQDQQADMAGQGTNTCHSSSQTQPSTHHLRISSSPCAAAAPAPPLTRRRTGRPGMLQPAGWPACAARPSGRHSVPPPAQPPGARGGGSRSQCGRHPVPCL